MPEHDDIAITVEALAASYGDCLFVTCRLADGELRILVDTGPDEASWLALRDRLAALPLGADGHRHIDLAIVSHIDHDHIGNASRLFGDRTLGLTFGDVWFNARHHLERGVAEGEGLAEILGASPAVPWNAAFGGGPVVTGDGKETPAFVALAAEPGWPRLTLLSPTPRRLEALARHWDRELGRLRAGESNTDDTADRGSETSDLDTLLAAPRALLEHKTRLDTAVANGSSIALLVEHRGASVLLAADAFPNVLGNAALQLTAHRGATAGPLRIDALKLSHHGSQANVPAHLFHALVADHYIVSTDNSRFNHPNDRALANVVSFGGRTPTLWFNFSTEPNLRWADENLQQRHNFTTEFPRDRRRGAVLDLAAKP